MRKTSGRTPRLVGAALLATGACAGGARPSPTGDARNAPPDSVQVGYGAQPKDKVMGAVSSMSSKDVSRRPLKIEELLRGRVAGLEIINRGNTVTFRIRGTGAMLADQEPLVVVDGIPIDAQNIDSALSGLTADNIRRVDVLKDVASTSVYGMRGAGGVIMISTKPIR